jgi:ATP-binding cassette subfamily B protein
MAGRTTILISHDLHLAHDADEILVVDHGRIAQRGTHAQLTSVNGKYAELWRAQSAGIGEMLSQQGQRDRQGQQEQSAQQQPEVQAARPLTRPLAPPASEPSLWRPTPA